MIKKIYLASPFFNDKEIKYVAEAEKTLRERGFDVYSPREHEYRGAEIGTPKWSAGIFKEDKEAIDDCDCVVMLYHGGYSDSGTVWECGYAYGTGKKVFVVHLGKDSNLMVHEGCFCNLSMEELKTHDFDSEERIIYTGEMF